MVGYVFMFFILLMTGIYFTAYNLQAAYPIFGITLSSITFIFFNCSTDSDDACAGRGEKNRRQTRCS